MVPSVSAAASGTVGLRGYAEHLRWLAGHATLVRMLARVQLRLTVRRSRLYYLWWLLDPVLDTALYAVLFLVIRSVNRMKAEEEAKPEPEPDPEPSAEEKLLTEIRDLLASKG